MVPGETSGMSDSNTSVIIEYFKQLYLRTDNEMALLNPSCKRGCPWCCFQSVEIVNWEEPMLREYLAETVSHEIKILIYENLLVWFDFHDRVMDGKSELSMEDAFGELNIRQAEEGIPCPFLIGDECSIYEVRPLCCRSHISVNGAEECKANPLRDSTPESEKYRKKVLADIVSNVPSTLRLLPYIAAPFFNLQNRVKPVRYMLIEPGYADED